MASIYRSKTLDALTAEALGLRDLDINLPVGVPLLACRGAAPAARAAAGVLSTSPTGWRAAAGPRYPGFTSYYVAKAGVVALTEALALELARDNILVNAIAPGPIVPPPDLSSRPRLTRWRPRRPWGDGRRSEIARAVVMLCETDFITGETIRVDGGRHLA